MEDVRENLAWVRLFARQLQQRLRNRPDDFSHLQGRVVGLAKRHEQVMPRDFGPLLTEIESALTEDKGYVGEDTDLTKGLPKQLGTRGLYGDHGVFNVAVNQLPGSSEIRISATSHLELYRSDVIKALENRIAEKDKESCNKILIVTCGRPDSKGYRCPSDHRMFLVLQEAIKAGIDILPKKPTNIRGILIHLWESPQVISWAGDENLPWTSQSGRTYTASK